MATCREVTRAIASDELAQAGWRARWAVRLHLLMCRHCRRYAEQIHAIGEMAGSLFRQEEDPEELARLQRSILSGQSAPAGESEPADE